jgi:hypothetical protein
MLNAPPAKSLEWKPSGNPYVNQGASTSSGPLKVRNPDTGRMVNTTGRIGKRALGNITIEELD